MSDTTTSPTLSGKHERPPLDDVMLAMDVVDTLRRRERLVARELDEIGREADQIRESIEGTVDVCALVREGRE